MVAWQWVYLQRSLSEIEPGPQRGDHAGFDDCPLYCHNDDLRPVEKCSECPVTEANEGFKADCERLLKKRVFKESRSPWSVDSLVSAVETIAGWAFAQGEAGYADNWTTTTCRLVGILRHEQYKARRIDDFNREQQLKR